MWRKNISRHMGFWSKWRNIQMYQHIRKQTGPDGWDREEAARWRK